MLHSKDNKGAGGEFPITLYVEKFPDLYNSRSLQVQRVSLSEHV